MTHWIENIADELSKAGYQLNWQEVAAINSAINKGDFHINNDNIMIAI